MCEVVKRERRPVEQFLDVINQSAKTYIRTVVEDDQLDAWFFSHQSQQILSQVPHIRLVSVEQWYMFFSDHLLSHLELDRTEADVLGPQQREYLPHQTLVVLTGATRI
jgi:hypothetical protein